VANICDNTNIPTLIARGGILMDRRDNIRSISHNARIVKDKIYMRRIFGNSNISDVALLITSGVKKVNM
jgi:hypothetical protein